MQIFAQDRAFYRPLRVDPTEDRQAEQRLAPAPHRRDPTRSSLRQTGLSQLQYEKCGLSGSPQ